MPEVAYEGRGGVRIMTLNRPETLNALSLEGEALQSHYLGAFRDDPEARVLIITGTGRAFSTGLDLRTRGVQSAPPGPRPPTLTSPDPLVLHKPVIAAIQGYALGGGLELALACDVRIAAEDARLGLPEVKRGLMPGAGGIQRLARAVPLGHACLMLFTGDWIDAQEAYRIGLVQRVVPRDRLLDAAVETAERIAANAPLALQGVKEALRHGQETPLAAALAFDRLLVWRNRQTEDAREGVRAFLEKRTPDFRGQ